jgi:hypothetical protein
MPANALGIIEGPFITVQSSAAVALGLRMVLASTGKYGVAGLTAIGEGIAHEAFAADGSYGVMRDINADGTQRGVASEAIAIADPVYTAADGKISKTATATGFRIGTAISAASADGVMFTWKRHNYPVVNP